MSKPETQERPEIEWNPCNVRNKLDEPLEIKEPSIIFVSLD